MENMPSREGLSTELRAVEATTVTSSDWRSGLPVLTGGWVTLRELRTDDADSLFALLTTEEVSRFISPPPSSVEMFKKFIEWTRQQRTAGIYACFAVTLKGFDTAIDSSLVEDWTGGCRRRCRLGGGAGELCRCGLPDCRHTSL